MSSSSKELGRTGAIWYSLSGLWTLVWFGLGAMGVFGVIGLVFSLFLLSGGGLPGQQPNPGVDMQQYIVREVPSYSTFTAVGGVLLVFAAAAALASGKHRWGLYASGVDAGRQTPRPRALYGGTESIRSNFTVLQKALPGRHDLSFQTRIWKV